MFKSFFSGPCTLWFNGITLFGKKYNWAHCCEAHDDGYDAYELAYDQQAYRLMQDEELRDCANKVLPGMGSVMFLGVRLFGRFCV